MCDVLFKLWTPIWLHVLIFCQAKTRLEHQKSQQATSLPAATPELSRSLQVYTIHKGGLCDFHSPAELLTAPWSDEGVALPCPPRWYWSRGDGLSLAQLSAQEAAPLP